MPNASKTPPCRRANWEFYVVLSGSCAMYDDAGELMLAEGPEMVVIRPNHSHGWRGLRSPWRVAVFHFVIVPGAFDKWLGERQWVRTPLTGDEADAISRLAVQTEMHWRNPILQSSIFYERALCEMCLIAMDKTSSQEQITLATLNARKVEEALGRFESRIAENPTVDAIAREINLSASHMRRLFREVLGRSPKDVFEECRIRRAKQLMVESADTLELIARQAGFIDANDLCRVFRRREPGLTPGKWRTRILSADNDVEHLRAVIGERFTV